MTRDARGERSRLPFTVRDAPVEGGTAERHGNQQTAKFASASGSCLSCRIALRKRWFAVAKHNLI
jgi:hypothetical protein